MKDRCARPQAQERGAAVPQQQLPGLQGSPKQAVRQRDTDCERGEERRNYRTEKESAAEEVSN
jgi:hypothetical protein